MTFPPSGSNAFRLRLDDATCQQLGIPDYAEVVGGEVMDLALVQTKLNKNEYEDDDAVRKDIQRIAANAATYHGASSDYATQGSLLVRQFDAVHAGGAPLDVTML